MSDNVQVGPYVSSYLVQKPLTCTSVFSSFQLHTVLDEIIFGGQVLETSSTEVLKAVEEIARCFLSPV